MSATLADIQFDLNMIRFKKNGMLAKYGIPLIPPPPGLIPHETKYFTKSDLMVWLIWSEQECGLIAEFLRLT